MPYKAPSGMNYDSGEFTAVLDKALAVADWHGFDEAQGRERQRAASCAAAASASYLEVTGPPSKEYGGIRFEDDGTITMLSGTLDYGQGHATPFAQVLGGTARHSVRRASGCCRAIRTSSRSAAAPAARSRRWSAARPSSKPATC